MSSQGSLFWAYKYFPRENKRKNKSRPAVLGGLPPPQTPSHPGGLRPPDPLHSGGLRPPDPLQFMRGSAPQTPRYLWNMECWPRLFQFFKPFVRLSCPQGLFGSCKFAFFNFSSPLSGCRARRGFLEAGNLTFSIVQPIIHPYSPLFTLICPYLPLSALICLYLPLITLRRDLIHPNLPLFTLAQRPYLSLFTLIYPYAGALFTLIYPYAGALFTLIYPYLPLNSF